MMRRMVAVSLGILLLSACASLGNETSETTRDFAIRLSGGAVGFPLSSGDVKLEAAAGFGDVCLSGFAELPFLPLWDGLLGAQASIARDWVRLQARLEYDATLQRPEVSLVGRIDPPSWLLYDGTPLLIGGVTAVVKTVPSSLWGRNASSLVLSPYTAGAFYAGDLMVTASVGFDLGVSSGSIVGQVTGSHLVSTVDVGSVSLINAVRFTGAFEAFASLSLTVEVGDLGLSVTGAMLPSVDGTGFVYRIGASIFFGNGALLPPTDEGAAGFCTGGTCFSP